MYVGNNNNSILVYEVEQIFYAGLQLIRINDLNHNQIGCCTDLKGTFSLYMPHSNYSELILSKP